MRTSRLLFIFVLLVLTPTAHLVAALQYDNNYKAAPLEPGTETVDILWEANTITPPWYKGRALASPGSNVRAIAIPHTGKSADSITYKWYKDTKLIKRATGKDANSIELPAPNVYGSYILSVELQDAQGRLLGRNGSRVVSTTPQVILYKSSPLLGTLYNSVLKTHTLQDAEPTITAVPFYFTLPNVGSLSYNWSMTGGVYETPTPNSITIINSNDIVSLTVRVSNNNQLLQSATAKHTLRLPHNSMVGNYGAANTPDDTPFNVIR